MCDIDTLLEQTLPGKEVVKISPKWNLLERPWKF
jgi:hypothetical protein